jgi:hypothetical protein
LTAQSLHATTTAGEKIGGFEEMTKLHLLQDLMV